MSRNIRTLGDFRGESSHDSGEESGGEGQEFYVGGSEHSGQQVLGPPSNRDANLVEKVFEAARKHGAEAMPAEELASSSGQQRGGSRFPGGGVRLGDDPADVSVPPAAEPVAEENAPEEQSNEVVVRLLMWENGFSLDDGPLRTFEEPENRQFMQSIMQGRIPPELVQAHPHKQVDLRMERKSGPYVAPKAEAKPFQGAGARLGAVVPQVISGSSSTPAAPAPTKDESAELLKKAESEVGLEEGAPVTQVQIRLNNGQRIVGKFNHSHTIAVVRNFIVAAHPEMAFAPFQMMTTFPNKMSLKAWLGIDKIQKLAQMAKQMGGVKAMAKKRYLMDVTRVGTLVGEDSFGNKYYENNSYFVPRNRWVEYPEKVWLDYDATQVPPEWHGWLHHITDDTPVVKPPQNEKWVLEHQENVSIYAEKKYIPYSTTRTKITGWQPGQQKNE